MIELSEAEVKRGVEDYLQIAMNQGELYYERLNAGDFIEVRGETRRRIKGAKKGTSDFFVVQLGQVEMSHITQPKISKSHPVAVIIFIEIKSTKGKQSPDQKEFEVMIKRFHCRYAIVRNVEELQEILR